MMPPPDYGDMDGDDIDLNDDVLIACVDLAGRSGAEAIEVGFTEDIPPRWYATATYRGARIMVQDLPTPTTAALALAERLLRGALCRCRRRVALSDSRAFAGTLEGCRWRLVGNRWEPGCDAPPFNRSELDRVGREHNDQLNREARRRGKRRP